MLMNLLLLLAFAQAPFQHYHHHDCPAWHPHGFFHVHVYDLQISKSQSAEFKDCDSDEDAQFQGWHAVASGSFFPVDVFLPGRIAADTASPSPVGMVESLIEGGHDPPICRLSNPRSPPA